VESQLSGKSLTYQIDTVKAAIETYKAIKQGYRFIVHQGSSRSGKTYNILKLLVGLSYKEKLATSVCSIAFPHLRRGAMRDWKIIMEDSNLYDKNSHFKTEQLYRYPSGGYMEFFSVDNSLKVRGPARDICFLNEANLIDQETFEQLNMRTRKFMIIDYNPADEFHWIYERILTDPSTYFIHTTYKDNPFLPKEQVAQIEALQRIDDNLWKVYGLGERGTNEAVIFPKWQLVPALPDFDFCFGLDFGFNHPTSLVKVMKDESNLFWEECFYRSHVTTPDLIEAIRPIVGHKYVECDSARPEIIQELRNAGINAKEANKNVKEGIDYIRSHNLFIHRDSVNLQKELRSYKWKQTPDKKVLDEPVKAYDDAIDAARYGTISYKNLNHGPILTFHR
jgi:phage terminase large subunit